MQTNPTTTTCPACSSTYVTALDTGNLFCAQCRHEWDPAAKPPAPTRSEIRAASRYVEMTEGPDAGSGESFVTFVDVDHDDGGSGNWRTDRYTYITGEPHAAARAEFEAIDHYVNEVGSDVALAVAVSSNFEWPTPDTFDVKDAAAELVPDRIASTDAESAAYLETLIGTGVTLDGGQRAVILGFEDDDKISVQLSTGDYALVDFNDIIHAENGPADVEIADVEIDDATAEVFGMASLLLACMVIEAGVASIEGEGDDAHLVPAATGWFPDDEDAVPVMETAAAGAVAMLVQTFALPRADIMAMVERIRTEALTTTATEAQGHDEHTDDNNASGDTDETGPVA